MAKYPKCKIYARACLVLEVTNGMPGKTLWGVEAVYSILWGLITWWDLVKYEEPHDNPIVWENKEAAQQYAQNINQLSNDTEPIYKKLKPKLIEGGH